jgi:hypothetical protein
MTSFRRQVPHLAISSQPQAARIAAVMVGNLVAEGGCPVLCRTGQSVARRVGVIRW